MKRQPQHQGGLYRHIRIMGLTAWAPSRRRLPFGDRLVRHPQRQAAAPPKAGFIRSPIPDLEFHLPEMMPTIGVVLVRHQKETRSVASGPAFYRLLPPKRQGIAVSVQQRFADRFHLLKNFRETVERQLGRFEAPIRQSAAQVEDDPDTRGQPGIERSNGCSEAAAHERLLRRGRAAARKAMFDEIRALYEAGSPVTEIARKLGLGPRRVYRWVRRIDLPEPSAMEPKACTPAYFGAFLARRWAEGTTKVRHLFSDIRHRGYTGSFSHLARFLAPWRSGSSPSGEAGERPSSDEEAPAPPRVRTLDPMTGRQISPLTAAALCVKPRGQMTDRQIVNVAALKAASEEFTTMRHLAMRFRGLLRGGTVQRLDIWLSDARTCGIYGMRRFARTLRQDIEAVRNAVLEPWSIGQTEGQINRLKTLKRGMYGRAGVDLLRARMMPLKG
jgi:hypothetical protein